MNQRYRRRSSSHAVPRLVALPAIASVLLPLAAHAQLAVNASADAQYESNSNVFNLSSQNPQLGPTVPRRDDAYFGYGANVDLDYKLGRQLFNFAASGNRFEYQHLTQLDHEDYSVRGGLNWTATSLVNGTIDVSRVRSMVPFYDLSGQSNLSLQTTLSLQTSQREEASMNVTLSPRWSISGNASSNRIDEPLPQAPDLTLTDSTGQLTLSYRSTARFVAGGFVGYETGSYDGTTPALNPVGPVMTANPDYHQAQAGLTSTYTSPRTTYSGQIGYSRRTSDAQTDSTSAVTGSVSLTERLTPKTSLIFTAGRSIQNYLLNTGSEIDSTLGLAADWNATNKLAVTLGYTYTYRDFPRQGNNPVGTDRVDIQSVAVLGITYQARPWISINPYANVAWRISNFVGGDFDSTVYGVRVTVQRPLKK